MRLRLDGIDWAGGQEALDGEGHALMRGWLTPGRCAGLRALRREGGAFRSQVEMARHGFGAGECRRLADPLPPAAAALREGAYRALVPLAGDWGRRTGEVFDLPPEHGPDR